MNGLRFFLFILLAGASRAEIPVDWQAAVNRVEAASLRGHVSFLAADALEGRDTPSRGLEVAAEYIASQFRRASLEPLPEGGYFLSSEWFRPAPGKRPQLVTNPGADGGDRFALRNVAGILRGSDPELRDTYVLIGAHYDHAGIRGQGEDRIFNGANDDASGTAAVIELANTLARLPVRTKRSIVFVAFFGEEKGMLGSRQYVRQPAAPISKTIAALCLEQLGRTDDSEGSRVLSANITGFAFTTLPRVIEQAGKETGVKVWKHEKASDEFFNRSDNIAFAQAGVPAHTLSVAYLFPDYHRSSDHWDKLDYDNMAAVVRTVGLGTLMLADSADAPRWNETEPKTEPYRNAGRQ
jgi:Zn-dependent M28 family amino/carboxypeptidase